MSQPFKDAVGFCKTIMRNGYDAYVINVRLQALTLDETGNEQELDICTEAGLDELKKYFPNMEDSADKGILGTLKEGGVTYYFYPASVEEAAYTDEAVSTMTPRLLKRLEQRGDIPLSAVCPFIPRAKDLYADFADFSEGQIRFKGVPDQALKKDYALAYRAMRFAANFDKEIEANSWVAIVRNARRVLDYVPMSDFLDEWRKVEAESMHKFFQLLFDSMLLHGLIPEIASLSRVTQIKNPEEDTTETVLEHTLDVMKAYPEELPYDWFGTVACLFHDIGKLYTAEFYDEKWNFLQHHRVGAKVTRKVLKRLRFEEQDIDLICELVQNHMRPHFMLTDKGIRRLRSLDEYPRIMEMVRADIKARDGSWREFNHNLKMAERADIPDLELEPLLDGNRIMELAKLKPGPAIGKIRDRLLEAQVRDDVKTVEDAEAFVLNYIEEHRMY
ncbi:MULTISPECIES: HD domain-containing protein [unclassified Pseudodesulfovibrio]|uniref:HD domain-containing protein n=1 Tax=unclassified Pseudodesulfovibrio TaxID=2661612 RepID=UPI000FEB72F7|nr:MULTISPECIES: HD domain-containing protein [unclassified Pseudodesulfovibrio]MCJ2166249.1 HD domain-containing protein [Pseudodesulfovibrio sp. S3-i]RWU02280.1 HD domain-containing protein [Pseudodesulfovibrio sp. S3]